MIWEDTRQLAKKLIQILVVVQPLFEEWSVQTHSQVAFTKFEF